MAKLRIEDALYFLIVMQIVAGFMLQLPLFDSYFPGMRWDNVSHTLVASNTSWNSTGIIFPVNNNTAQEVNVSTLSGSSLLNPIELAYNFGQLILTYMNRFSIIYPLVNAVLGSAAATLISTIWYAFLGIAIVKIVSGRLSWG